MFNTPIQLNPDEPNCTCWYCGLVQYVSEFTSEKYRRCKSCNDPNLIKINKYSKIDTYEGSPAFENKREW